MDFELPAGNQRAIVILVTNQRRDSMTTATTARHLTSGDRISHLGRERAVVGGPRYVSREMVAIQTDTGTLRLRPDQAVCHGSKA
jgi:hypothetical protein